MLVGAGFDYVQVLDMTWSQLLAYSKAVGLDRIEGWRMQLAIAHNPFAADKETPKMLFRHLDQAERDLLNPDSRTEPTRPKGLSLTQLKKVMGSVKENLLSREEWERQQAARSEQKAKAVSAMAELRAKRLEKNQPSSDGGA
jgi:hypothetical protein